MAERRTSILQVAFLAIAAALGVATLGTSEWAVTNMQWGFVGLPVAAASAAALVYRKHTVVAAVAFAVGVAGAVATNFWSVWAAARATGVTSAPGANAWTVLFAASAALAVFAAIVLLRRVSYLWVGSGLITVFAAAGYGLDVALARSKGTSLGQEVVAQSKTMAAEVSTVLSPERAAQFTKQVAQTYKQAATVLPSTYFFAGTFLAVVVIAAIAWSARRADEPVNVPPFHLVDLPPLMILGAVIALLMLGFAKVASAGPMWTTVGMNVLLCTSYLLLIQGLAVYSALLKRAHVGTLGRAAAYVVLLVLNLLLSIVTLTGLADMWINFRRLPREGRPDLPLKRVTSHGDESSGV
jgi:hypothetical protein